MTFVAAAEAAECPRKDALGTSRSRGGRRYHPARRPQELSADAAARRPRSGADLRRRTVALTTPKILAALAHECVRATFFLIGKPASEHPELVRRMAAQGHTIAHHTWTHHNLKYMKPAAAIGEIDKGIAAVETALHGTATTTPSTPFFRFPFFDMTPATLDACRSAASPCSAPTFWASD